MEITSREYKRAIVLRVVGRVDAATAPEFEAELRRRVQEGAQNIVLEMDGTDYMSSAAIRALISIQKSLKPKGGTLVLAQPSTRAREVIQLAGIDALLPIFDDTVAAIGSV